MQPFGPRFALLAAAVRATNSLFQMLPTDELRSFFSPLLSTLIATSQAHLTKPHTTPDHHELSVTLLENLIEFVSCCFPIALQHLPAISQMCFIVIRPPSPPDQDLDPVRQLALEMVLTMAECNPSFCRSLSLPSNPPASFSDLLLNSCFTFLLEPCADETTEEWVAAESHTFDAIDIDHAEIGRGEKSAVPHEEPEKETLTTHATLSMARHNRRRCPCPLHHCPLCFDDDPLHLF